MAAANGENRSDKRSNTNLVTPTTQEPPSSEPKRESQVFPLASPPNPPLFPPEPLHSSGNSKSDTGPNDSVVLTGANSSNSGSNIDNINNDDGVAKGPARTHPRLLHANQAVLAMTRFRNVTEDQRDDDLRSSYVVVNSSSASEAAATLHTRIASNQNGRLQNIRHVTLPRQSTITPATTASVPSPAPMSGAHWSLGARPTPLDHVTIERSGNPNFSNHIAAGLQQGRPQEQERVGRGATPSSPHTVMEHRGVGRHQPVQHESSDEYRSIVGMHSSSRMAVMPSVSLKHHRRQQHPAPHSSMTMCRNVSQHQEHARHRYLRSLSSPTPEYSTAMARSMVSSRHYHFNDPPPSWQFWRRHCRVNQMISRMTSTAAPIESHRHLPGRTRQHSNATASPTEPPIFHHDHRRQILAPRREQNATSSADVPSLSHQRHPSHRTQKQPKQQYTSTIATPEASNHHLNHRKIQKQLDQHATAIPTAGAATPSVFYHPLPRQTQLQHGNFQSNINHGHEKRLCNREGTSRPQHQGRQLTHLSPPPPATSVPPSHKEDRYVPPPVALCDSVVSNTTQRTTMSTTTNVSSESSQVVVMEIDEISGKTQPIPAKRPLSPTGVLVRDPALLKAKKSKGFDKLDLLCSATLEIGPLLENPSGCNCPKSRCIALYCDCFKAGRRCNPKLCNCVDCKNTVEESGVNGARTKAIRAILTRNPRAFLTAGISNQANQKNLKPGQVACNCVRSQCLKLYCSCFQMGRPCDPTVCTCVGCLNTKDDAGGHRLLAMQQCLEKRPDAFGQRVKDKGMGCACKNNRCIRKYCECFRMQQACTESCTCRQCQNTPEHRSNSKSMDSPDSNLPTITINGRKVSNECRL